MSEILQSTTPSLEIKISTEDFAVVGCWVQCNNIVLGGCYGVQSIRHYDTNNKGRYGVL